MMQNLAHKITILSFVAISLCTMKLHAQDQKLNSYRISGVIVEAQNNKPLPGAEISLINKIESKSLVSTIASERGTFTLQTPQINLSNCILLVQAKGHKLFQIGLISNNSNTKISLDSLKLSPEPVQLNEVKVTTSPLYQNIDKTVLVVSNDIVTTSPTILDVFTHMPFVSIANDADVTLKGKTGVKFYLDGRPVTIERIRSIPPSKIAKVELISNPGAEYDAEGTNGVINVILKEDKIDGYEGNISASAATMNKYNATVFGSLKKKRSTTTLNYVINSVDKKGYKNGYISQNDSISTQNSQRTNNQIYQYAGIGENYQFDNKNVMGASFGWYNYNFKRTNNILYGGEIASLFSQLSSNNNTNITGLVFDVDFKHSFDKSKNLTFSYRNSTVNTSDTLIQSTSTFNRNKVKFSENTYQIIFNDILKPKYILQSGLKLIDRNNNSSGLYQQASAITNQTSLKYLQDIYAAYTTLSFPLSKSINTKIGGRFEMTHTDADFDPGNSLLRNDYNFFPSLTIMKNFAGGQSLRLNYSEKIARPSIDYLNPYINQVDPQNILSGNPNLKFEINRSVELKYSATVKITYFETAFVFNSAPNQIIGIVTPLSNGRTLSTFLNAGDHNTYQFNGFISTKAGKKWDISASFVIEHSSITGNGQQNSGLNSFFSLDNTVKLFNGYILSVGGTYNSRQITLQGYAGESISDNIRISKRYLKNALTARLGIEDPLSQTGKYTEFYSQGNFQSKYKYGFENRRLAFSLSYSFGKQNSTDPYANKINNSDLKQAQ